MRSNTSNRLKEIMLERNLKQVDILRLTKPYCKKFGVTISKGSMSQYVSGFVEPNQRKLTIIALALNVSEAWLMGYDVPRERTKPVMTTDEQLAKAIEILSDEQKKILLALIDNMLSTQK